MFFLASLFTNRLFLGGLVALLIVGAIAGLYAKGRIDGKEALKNQQRLQLERAKDDAQKSQDEVDDCYDVGGRWLQSQGRCIMPSVPAPKAHG